MTKEVRKEYMRKYRQEHKEDIKEYRKKWAKENPEKNREYRLSWRKKNNGYHKKYSIDWRKKYPWRTHYSHAMERCDNPRHDSYKWYGGKGVRFKLTLDEVKTLYKRDNAKDMDWASIDRIDSNNDYVFDNCRFIEQSENSR